jgi:SAM-dependent methyltransferase
VAGVWNHHAEQWRLLGSPLRPNGDDIRVFERWALCACARSAGGPHLAVLLGVTPECACMRWPDGTELTAVDRSPEMVRAVWPAEAVAVPARVVLGDWQSLPLSSASVDIVLGDGCFTTLDSPERYRTVAREVRRILRPGAAFLQRFFVRPEWRESLTGVFSDLRARRIRSFHSAKWRVAMALQERFEDGVRLGDIWETFHEAQLDASALEKELDWAPGTVATIDAYRGLDTRYTFPTLEEVRKELSADFSEIDCSVPSYELGERCPRLRLSPKG